LWSDFLLPYSQMKENVDCWDWHQQSDAYIVAATSVQTTRGCWHKKMNAWRWRFGSSLLLKGECCTMRIVEVLISNGLPISARFKIGRSTMSGVHSSPSLRSCGWSPIGGSRFFQRLWGGELFGDSDDPSSSDFESTKSSFLAWCASRLLSL
jgi:hypothetical protein